jgi:hypothetical protein
MNSHKGSIYHRKDSLDRGKDMMERRKAETPQQSFQQTFI